MANFIQSSNFSNNFSENLMPIGSVFQDINQPKNITSGTGNIITGFVGNTDYSCEVNVSSFTTTDFAFNFGDTLKTPLGGRGGNFLFQLSIRDVLAAPNSFIPFEFQVLVYKDNVYSETIDGTFDLDPVTSSNKWFAFYQNIYIADTVGQVNFVFKVLKDIAAPTSVMNFQLGQLKLEHDIKNLYFPTPYSLPRDYYFNPYTGWGYYADSLATPTVTIGTTYTQITIDTLGANIIDYLPKEIRGSSNLFALSKITPISIGDDYDGRFDCTITAKTGSPTAIELIIDISGGTAGSNKAFTGWLQAIGTAPYDQSMPLDFFALETFKTNGGKIYARTDTGTVTIGRRNIKISRKSKAF